MSDESREISIFLAAIDKKNEDERAAYLDRACGDDQQLRDHVEALVATHRRGNSFLERPAPGLNRTVNINQTALDAGLAATFGAEAAVVFGDAGHSVLKALGENLPNVPHIVLGEDGDGSEMVLRPNTADVPPTARDSRYQFHGEIARGGMGAVIKARDADLGRDLAIKVLLDSHKEKPEILQRFVEEAQIGGQLQHPGIVPVYELGQFGDRRPFFSMKLVKGDTFAALLTRRKDSGEDLPKHLGIFEQVCQTMAYAHNKRVIHRDLKPANIMVGAFGEVQVMDWGLAKVLGTGGIEDEKKSLDKHRDVSVIQTRRSTGSDLPDDVGSQTQMGSVLGTPAYMPPEQALGEVDRLDERADVFGLGAILCEILTGKPPYIGTDGTQIFRQARRGKMDDCFARLENCGADRELIELAKQMLAAEQEDRMRSAGEVAEALTNYLTGVQERLKQSELARAEEHARAEDAVRRRKLHVAIAALMLLLAVGAGFSAVRFWRQREAQSVLATKNSELAKDNAAKRLEAERAHEQTAIEKTNVETQRDRALALQEMLRRELYVADMQQLQQAYQEGASDRVDVLLRKYVPTESESDLRGWEWYYWWRISHLHEQYFQDPEPFSSLAVSPDRSWLAVRGWPNDVHIVDARTLRETRLIQAGDFRHPFGWTEFAISRDGRLFACISNRYIRIFNTEDWSELPSLEHEHYLQAIAFSSTGLLAAADTRGRVTFWDVERNVMEGSPLETGHSLSCLAISPDGKRLVTGHLSADINGTPSLLVWDISERRLEEQLLENMLDVTALSWHATGDLNLIAAGFADGVVRLWEGDTYSERAWLHAGGSVLTLAFSPNGERLVAGTARDNSVMVWETNSGQRVSVMKGHFRPVSGVGFAEDGEALWSCSQDGFVKRWNVSNTATYRRLSADFPISQAGLAFGAAGQSLWLLLGTEDIFRWNSITGESLPDLTIDESAKRIAFSNNGRFLAVFAAGEEGRNGLQVWRADAADPILQTDIALDDDPVGDSPSAIAISDNGSVVSWFRDRDLTILDVTTGKQTSAVLPSPPSRLTLSSDGKRLIESGWDSRIWDISGGTLENTVSLSGYPATDVQFSPDGKYVAQSHENNLVHLYEATTGEILQYFRGHAGGVKAIDFSPDGTLLASGGVDGTVRLWHVEHRSLVVTLSGHNQPISSVEFSSDGQSIASISNDGDTRVWDASTASTLQDLRYHIWLAGVYQERGFWSLALDEWTHVLTLAPEDASLFMSRCEAHLQLQQLDEAVADYERAFRYAELADYDRLLAIGAKLGSEPTFDSNEAFIDVLSRTLEADPMNQSLLQQRVELLSEFHRWDEAAADFAVLLEIQGKSPDWSSGSNWSSDRSRHLMELTRHQPLFDALRGQMPYAHDLWLARGRSLALRCEWSASLSAFNRYESGISGDSSVEPEIWFEIACLHRICGDDHGYRRSLNRLRDQAGENPVQFDAFVLARIAGLCTQDPELAQQAVRWGELALASDPRPWEVHALGMALFRTGEYDAAIETLLDSLASGWDDAQNQLALALVQQAVGEESQAEDLIGEASRWREDRLMEAVDGTVNVQAIDWLAIHALFREVEKQLPSNGN